MPHGIWGSGDGSRVYVGLENGDCVQAIDVVTNRVIATIPVDLLPQALVYVPAATISDAGNANLKPLGAAAEALHIELVPPAGTISGARASVSVNSLGPIDNIQAAVTGLRPAETYRLVLTGGSQPQDLVTFQAGIGGTAISQSFGPIKRALRPSEKVPAMTLEGDRGKAAAI
jgi:YVTN family beta-propeller protein